MGSFHLPAWWRTLKRVGPRSKDEDLADLGVDLGLEMRLASQERARLGPVAAETGAPSALAAPSGH